MTINIIHDLRRLDRKVLFKNELIRQGITDFKVWDSVHSQKTMKQNISLAHKRIVQDAKDKGVKEVCIAEDDFYFPARDGFKYFMANKPKSFDLYLAGVYVGNKKLNETNNIISLFSGLHFYIVNSRFYDFFLSLPIDNSIDNELSKLSMQGYGKYVVCYPMAAIQHEVPSDNNKGVIYKHKDRFEEKSVYGLKFG
jgi:hypothetical protein